MNNSGGRVLALVAILLAIVAIAASVTGVVAAANGSFGNSSAPRTISAQGQGSARVTPDQATLSVGAQTRALSVDAALSNNSAKLNAIIAALEKAGVSASHLQTSDLSMYQDSPSNDYVVTHTLTVQLDSADKVGAMLVTATNAGANSSWGVSFGVKDSSAARRQAMQKALADARKQADNVAAALGVTITRVQSENEVLPSGQQYAGGGLGGGGGGAPVQSGQNQITANVTVTYAVR